MDYHLAVRIQLHLVRATPLQGASFPHCTSAGKSKEPILGSRAWGSTSGQSLHPPNKSRARGAVLCRDPTFPPPPQPQQASTMQAASDGSARNPPQSRELPPHVRDGHHLGASLFENEPHHSLLQSRIDEPFPARPWRILTSPLRISFPFGDGIPYCSGSWPAPVFLHHRLANVCCLTARFRQSYDFAACEGIQAGKRRDGLGYPRRCQRRPHQKVKSEPNTVVDLRERQDPRAK